MQLREYLAILRRLWPVVLLLPLLAGGLSLALALGRPPAYQASARLLVTLAPPAAAAPAPLPALDDGATWATTEYILDDLPFVLSSAAFAADVGAAMAAEGYPADPGAIQAGLRPEVTHRSVLLTATAAGPEQAGAMLRGALGALERGGLKYWGRADAGGLQGPVLDPPGPAAPAGGLRDLVREVGLRVALALAAGVGLAFLLHYLDDRLRSPRQAEDWVGARVLAVIPKEK
ncbi:MAG TPA: lipopolysaccharide biosynthesis protein [Chloroflexaceae bacterium]|nr:lipopolysaccharide biosynthesis protein [Chloroflexaceae bacterium]